MTEDTTTTDTMRLRAEPPRVTRLSRKMLAGVGAVALFGIGGALIYALQTRDMGGSGEELYSTENRPTADGCPACRATIPAPSRPALPGDRRPHPRRAEPGPAGCAARHDDARRRSGGATPHRRGGSRARQPRLFQTAPNGNRKPESRRSRSDRPARCCRHTGSAHRLPQWPRGSADRRPTASWLRHRHISFAGAVIPAAMITGIRSDLPGQITAQVTENVYDSPTGSLLLIPQGTRIIGQYDAGVTFGQRRVLLVWNRLILPNGRSIVLERQPGADASGYAGLEDGVDYHWWDLMKAAGLSTLLGIGTELATDEEDRLIRAIRDGAQDTINQAGQQIVQRQLQVAPTLTIRPGFPVRVIVT